MRSVTNILLVFIVGFEVSARGLQPNTTANSSEPSSIPQHEKILRLFISLITETTNYIVRLKNEVKSPNETRNNQNSTQLVKGSINQNVTIANRMMIDAGKNDTSGQAIVTESTGNRVNGTGETTRQSPGSEMKEEQPGQLTNQSTVQTVQPQIKSETISSRDSGGVLETTGQTAGTSEISQVAVGQLSSLPTAQTVTTNFQSTSIEPKQTQIANGTGERMQPTPRPGITEEQPGQQSNLSTIQTVDPKVRNHTSESADVNVSGQFDPTGLMTTHSSPRLKRGPVDTELNKILGPVADLLNPSSIFNLTSILVNRNGNLGRILDRVTVPVNPIAALTHLGQEAGHGTSVPIPLGQGVG